MRRLGAHRSNSFVEPDDLTPDDDVTGEGRQETIVVSPGGEIELGVERKELKEVAMQASAGGRRSRREADVAAIVQALAKIIQVGVDRLSVTWNAVDHPVHEWRRLRRIWVFADQRVRRRLRVERTPRQRWRRAVAINRRARRQSLAAPELRALELEARQRHGVQTAARQRQLAERRGARGLAVI